MRDVTLVPSRPAIGESFTAKRIDSVGGSIGWAWSGSVTEISAMVLDTVATVRPASEMMSPAWASSAGTRSSPRKVMIFEARPVSTILPSLFSAWIGWLSFTVPELTRPVRMRPRKLSRSSRVTRKVKGASTSTVGAGTWLTIVSNIGVSVPSRAFSSVEA